LGRRVREELEQSEDAREGSDDGDIDMLALAELRAQHDGDGGAQHGESGKGDIESLDNRHGLLVHAGMTAKVMMEGRGGECRKRLMEDWK